MMVPLLLGLTTGIGLWLIVVAARPRPVPLAKVLADLHRPAGTTSKSAAGGPVIARLLEVLAALGMRTPQRDQQLALAGITPHDWARDKLIGATGGLAVPVMVWAALSAIGIQVAPAVGLLALAGAVAGFFLPDLKLREQVEQRRKAFQYALSAYLDLVNVILAGGGGIETALVAAADAGEGWAFARLRHALHRAQRINQPLWTAFDDLGAELDVAELRDLASSIGLAGAQGARIRASLAVKADTLRSHQLAETEAAAEATTERMNLPTAVLLLGFLIFIVFPAVTAITGVNAGTCIPGEPDCPTPVTPAPDSQPTIGPDRSPTCSGSTSH
jgi:tight adherence protein C